MAEHALIDRARQRSLGFLEWEGQKWACFLITFQGHDKQWHGHLSFRPRDSEGEVDEVRTADIFIEASESEIDHKARGLGRPLLRSLFSSALHAHQKDDTASPKLRRWFRKLLSENSRDMAAAAGDCLDDPSGHNDPGIVDQSVQAPAAIPDRFDGGIDLFLNGDVEPNGLDVVDGVQRVQVSLFPGARVNEVTLGG